MTRATLEQFPDHFFRTVSDCVSLLACIYSGAAFRRSSDAGAAGASPLSPLGRSRSGPVSVPLRGLMGLARVGAVPKLGAREQANTEKRRREEHAIEAAAPLVDFALLLALEVLDYGPPPGPPLGPPVGRQVFRSCFLGKAEKTVANVPAGYTSGYPYGRESGPRRFFFWALNRSGVPSRDRPPGRILWRTTSFRFASPVCLPVLWLNARMILRVNSRTTSKATTRTFSSMRTTKPP